MKTTSGTWQKVTARKAAYLFRRSVSADEQIFMCRLCGQYVTFVCGDIQRDHFRHSSSEQSKECEERSQSFSTDSLYYDGTESSCDETWVQSLPLRIKVRSDDDFELKLGFFQVPSSLLNEERKIEITSSDPSWKGYVYSSASRIEEGKISYLSVGNNPQACYFISVTPPDEELDQYWPNTAEGITAEGALFSNHKRIGNRLQRGTNVIVGHKYLLLTKQSLLQSHSLLNLNIKNLNIKLVCWSSANHSKWYVYEVAATALGYGTRLFFSRLGYELSEDSVAFIPVWPSFIESPYLFKHYSDQMVFFFRGNDSLQVFPSTDFQSYQCNDENLDTVFLLDCSEERLFLSSDRNSGPQSVRIWRDLLDQKTSLPNIKVYDLKDKEIIPGEHTSLPFKKSLLIITPFDGYAVIKKRNIIIEKRQICSNQKIELNRLQHGFSVEIFQGLDIVWSVRYSEIATDSATSDSSLLNELENCRGSEIDVPHSLGSIVTRMGAYPKTKLWLYKHIRSGQMSQRAYDILISHFSRIREGNHFRRGSNHE